jgi:serine/threonine protein kinase
MSLPTGTRIGIFEITAKLGEGGMGPVYRPSPRPGPDFTLKALPAMVAGDPNIVSIYSKGGHHVAHRSRTSMGHADSVQGG